MKLKDFIKKYNNQKKLNMDFPPVIDEIFKRKYVPFKEKLADIVICVRDSVDERQFPQHINHNTLWMLKANWILTSYTNIEYDNFIEAYDELVACEAWEDILNCIPITEAREIRTVFDNEIQTVTESELSIFSQVFSFINKFEELSKSEVAQELIKKLKEKANEYSEKVNIDEQTKAESATQPVKQNEDKGV